MIRTIYRGASLLISMVITLGLAGFHPQSVHAAVILDESLTQPVITNTFSVAQEQPGDYLEPTNSYNDGNPTYIFVTRDPAKAGTTSITYHGSTYPVTTLVSNGNDLSTLHDDSGKILRKNMTIFFDSGTYNDPDSHNYFGFSKTNLSLVGLTAGTVTITRSPNVDERGNKTMERTGFQDSNIYLENLIFDGQSINMAAKPLGKESRGEFFFFFAKGSTNFVMKNCVIQNVGASNSGFTNKNVAMNFYQSSGQHNFENVTFKNIKTQFNYGIISFNDSKDNYFKNITLVDDNAYGSDTFSVKVEHTAAPISINEITNVFSGTLSLPTDSNHNFVYIQDFNYDKTVLPAAFRYAQYKNKNGGNSTSAIQVYQSVLPGVTANTGILDLNDNSWLVRASDSSSISQQLNDLLAVRTGMELAGALSKWPGPNIKISATLSGEIGSFNIPAFPEAVNIVAVPTTNDLFSSTILVPFTAAGVISLTPSTQLFNFDFQAKAKYTLAEVTSHRGLSYVTLADPYETGTISGYPVYHTYGYSTPDVAPIFTNATAASFGNCKFISLANEIEIATPSSTSIGIGSALQLTAALKDSDTNSFTGSGFSGSIKDTADDPSIGWYSSDPSIASVDQTTGLVTAVGLGTVDIIAKANDIYNQGEIEKPFDIIPLTIQAQSHLLDLSGTSDITQTSASKPASLNKSLPITGFAPDRLTALPSRSSAYDQSDLWLEIPILGMSGNIVGVPQTSDGWDVSWLGNDIGWLNGTSWPGWDGNAVLTAHNYGADGLPGPFVNLSTLHWGDRILLHDIGGIHIYEVRENTRIPADDAQYALSHKDQSWLTLVTCSGYSETSSTYLYRQVVQAVLIEKK